MSYVDILVGGWDTLMEGAGTYFFIGVHPIIKLIMYYRYNCSSVLIFINEQEAAEKHPARIHFRKLEKAVPEHSQED